MRYRRGLLVGIILCFCLMSTGFTEDFSLQYFLAKASSGEGELSEQEKTELLNRMEGMMEKVRRMNRDLIKAVRGGEVKMEYEEGAFWMSKFEEDREAIETAIQQLQLLKGKPVHLTGGITLYKSLRDLSSNLNAYNNTLLFSAFVGDLAPEITLWADPVFYQLYLLPLAAFQEMKAEPPEKEKKPAPKKKKP